MVRVNVDNLNALIKKNNLYLSSYNSNSKKLTNAINDLNSCYSGNSLQYLFDGPLKEIKSVQTISKLIGSYSNILLGVKLSYQKQEQRLNTQIKNMDQIK